MRPVSAMRGGQVLAFSVTLVAAGVLLTRGFIGLTPARPVFLVLGALLAVSALLGLGLEHVEVRSVHRSPDHVLIDELHRSRRFGHPLSLVRVRCDDTDGQRVIARLRGTDRAWRQRGWLYVLLAETDGGGAAELVQRIVVDLPGVEAQRASFPDEALTIDGLIEVLRREREPSAAVATMSVTYDDGVADGEASEKGVAPVFKLSVARADLHRNGSDNAPDGAQEVRG